ncbi:nucleotidyl transferase AbiEii/AbiGii toxin family protein [Myceligenerans crystallogenes]|uniref:Nucleotidyl transferase AbiEii toxin, Type IV TA system n=1 Tax=Myceligenerans crystallogenes TaxID=316335 RepID=A0ABN2NIW7_9MICO
MYDGELEIHLTVDSPGADRLDGFAAQHGIKVSHIELDHGRHRAQPMLTVMVRGSLEDGRRRAEQVREQLAEARIATVRVKIEAVPWNDDVPVSDDDAPAGLHFEHHVKLRLPADDLLRRVELSGLAREHGARVSRNARRKRTDASEERFVTQRCFGVGRTTARGRLDGLLADLAKDGFEVLEVEEEYVVVDDNLPLDAGWMDHRPQDAGPVEPVAASVATAWTDQQMRYRLADGRSGFPATFEPPATGDAVIQHAVFEPAHKEFTNAYKAGQPVFHDPAHTEAWGSARDNALAHVMRTLAASPWADCFVLRGSVTLPVWLGDAARAPGDIDVVVVPRTIGAEDPTAVAMLDGLLTLLTADPGPGLRASDAARESIWTYERAEGRRIVVPYDVDGFPAGDGMPVGSVQVDFVFGEELLADPVVRAVPPSGVEMLVAPPDLQLAWKIQWLVTDMYPQGRDLYDAVLLADVADLSWDLLTEVLGAVEDPWWDELLQAFTAANLLGLEVDWENFRSEHPDVAEDPRVLVERLVLAVHRVEKRHGRGAP